MAHSTKQSVLFPDLISKPCIVAFDEPEVTSDGGVLLLKAVDRQIGLIYRQRGDSENRIKEMKGELDLGRLSCHGFWANQLRLLLSAAAFVIMQMLRVRLTQLGLATNQVGTLRLRLLKIGGRITRSVRRYVIHLAATYPWAREWQRAARTWGAISP